MTIGSIVLARIFYSKQVVPYIDRHKTIFRPDYPSSIQITELDNISRFGHTLLLKKHFFKKNTIFENKHYRFPIHFMNRQAQTSLVYHRQLKHYDLL